MFEAANRLLDDLPRAQRTAIRVELARRLLQTAAHDAHQIAIDLKPEEPGLP